MDIARTSKTTHQYNEMRFTKILFLLIASVAISQNTFAQSKLLKKASHAYENYEFYKAIDLYKRAYSKSSDRTQKIDLSFKLAECARRIGNYRQAESYYKRTIKMRYDDPLALLYLAMMQQNLGKYDKAIESYKNYSEKVPEDARAADGIASCELAADWTANPSRYDVVNMKRLNSKFDDRMPAFGKNDFSVLYFTTARDGVTKGKPSAQTGQNFTDIWVTKLEKQKKKRGKKRGSRKAAQKWSEPMSMGEYLGGAEDINTRSDEGAVSLNERGNLMYFTRAIMEKKAVHAPRVYSANKKGGEWELPIQIDIPVDSNYMVMFPCIAPDEKTLYFVSDMPGGEGDFDIWVSEYNKRKKTWSEPVNMGPEVNTPGMEIAPFLHKDGTMFFASTGHEGMGGFDIYRATKRPSGQFGKVRNMKYPINSSYDDFGLIFAGKDFKNGYLSSNRKGGRGGDDIYSVKLADLKFKMEGLITDQETTEPLIGVSVHLQGSDGSQFDAITNKDGIYNFGDEAIKQGVDYEVSYNKDTYVTVLDTVTTQNLTIHDFERTDEGFTYTIVSELPLKVFRLPIVLPHIEYDLGSAELRELAKKDLDKLARVLETNPSLRIQLRSHTDFRGGDDFNKELSQRRAESCVNYLIEQGIDASRLVPVGMGEDEPLTLQEKRNGITAGTVLSKEYIGKLRSSRIREAAHQMNRRTDFKKIDGDNSSDDSKFGKY